MTDTETMELLAVGRTALAQALRQWAMYANDQRHELDLGAGDELEDRSYNTTLATLKRLGAAADEIEDARIAAKTAFAAAPGSEKPLTEDAREALRWLFAADGLQTVQDAREYIEWKWGAEVGAELKAFAAASQND